jgi:hypothetical protein
LNVDGNGVDERVYYLSLAMTQAPHIAEIVKNGEVIFSAAGSRIRVSEVPDNLGFFLSFVPGVAEYSEVERYTYQNNKFVPLYKQTICSVRFSE